MKFINKRGYKISLLLCFSSLLFLPKGSLASKNIIFQSKEYNINQTLSPGQIVTFSKPILINLGDEELEANLFFSLDESNKENGFILEPKELFLEPGKAKLVDLVLQIPINFQAGTYQGNLLARSKNIQSDVSDNAETSSHINFTVKEAGYSEAIYQRFISLIETREHTFLLFLFLLFLWLIILIILIFIIIRRKF